MKFFASYSNSALNHTVVFLPGKKTFSDDPPSVIFTRSHMTVAFGGNWMNVEYSAILTSVMTNVSLPTFGDVYFKVAHPLELIGQASPLIWIVPLFTFEP